MCRHSRFSLNCSYRGQRYYRLACADWLVAVSYYFEVITPLICICARKKNACNLTICLCGSIVNAYTVLLYSVFFLFFFLDEAISKKISQARGHPKISASESEEEVFPTMAMAHLKVSEVRRKKKELQYGTLLLYEFAFPFYIPLTCLMSSINECGCHLDNSM